MLMNKDVVFNIWNIWNQNLWLCDSGSTFPKSRAEMISSLSRAAVSLNVAYNEIKPIVSGSDRRALIWMVAAGVRGRETEKKDTDLTWFEWETAN